MIHANRLHCQRGCSSCCVDDLEVFDVEAEEIRKHHHALLAEGSAHPIGACAFLDESGACRIYEERPYVCRTQGLPLRWIDDVGEQPVELRDICPLNGNADPIEEIPADDCWTLGPTEEKLALLQFDEPDRSKRVRLRSLFANGDAEVDLLRERADASSMGDKSPKNKDKEKKRDAAGKNQQKADAASKQAQSASAGAAKKGK